MKYFYFLILLIFFVTIFFSCFNLDEKTEFKYNNSSYFGKISGNLAVSQETIDLRNQLDVNNFTLQKKLFDPEPISKRLNSLEQLISSNQLKLQQLFVPGDVILKIKKEFFQTATDEKAILSLLESKYQLHYVSGDLLRFALFKNQSLKCSGELGKAVKNKSWGSSLSSKLLQTVLIIKQLNQENIIEYAEPNNLKFPYTIPNDVYYPNLWHYTLMNVEQGWKITTGDDNLVIGVIDSGYTPHPDIASRISSEGYDLIEDSTNAGDGDGIDADATDLSSDTHGTHVSGTIGAIANNNLGICGITWKGKILPVRAMGVDGYGTDYDVVNGIYYAIGESNSSGNIVSAPAKVINMSLGSSSSSASERKALQVACTAGVTVVVASGNDGGAVSYPAAYPEVIAIGAVGTNSSRASYSNYGASLDLVAPGGDMVTSQREGVFSLLSSMESNYFYYGFNQGTSMACPHAAGAVALLLSINPTLTPEQVLTYLCFTALDLGVEGRDNSYGYGLIDTYKANLAVLLSTISFDTSPIYIVLLDSNGELAYQKKIIGAYSNFTLTDIIPGSYTMLISSDFNNNQIIGDLAELSSTFFNVVVEEKKEKMLSTVTLNLITANPSQYVYISN